MTVYIENNTYLLAILNSTQVDSFYIVLRRLITFLNQRTVHTLFHMESYIARTATTPSSLASNSKEAHLSFNFQSFPRVDHPLPRKELLLLSLYCLIQPVRHAQKILTSRTQSEKILWIPFRKKIF